ncbi:MAG: hypothetical protein CSA62_15100 [Planctomycetota bacterium]|nr:MAG: hypothetical protein CSA62_15100 [Planctomycetota bacterium]
MHLGVRLDDDRQCILVLMGALHGGRVPPLLRNRSLSIAFLASQVFEPLVLRQQLVDQPIGKSGLVLLLRGRRIPAAGHRSHRRSVSPRQTDPHSLHGAHFLSQEPEAQGGSGSYPGRHGLNGVVDGPDQANS